MKNKISNLIYQLKDHNSIRELPHPILWLSIRKTSDLGLICLLNYYDKRLHNLLCQNS